MGEHQDKNVLEYRGGARPGGTRSVALVICYIAILGQIPLDLTRRICCGVPLRHTIFQGGCVCRCIRMRTFDRICRVGNLRAGEKTTGKNLGMGRLVGRPLRRVLLDHLCSINFTWIFLY